MSFIKIKNLKKAEEALKDMPIPPGVKLNSEVGILVENVIGSAGYEMNSGAGCDIQGIAPKTNIEVKTREEDATSARQIGTMTYKDIISTDWDDSPLKKKFQQQFIVYWSKQRMVVTSAKMYDFTHDEIQSILRDAYEQAREIFAAMHTAEAFDDPETKANDVFGNYVRGIKDDCTVSDAYFEYKNSNSYEFRFTDAFCRTLEDMSERLSNKLFDWSPV
jgi:hypothetical protein